MNKTEYDLAVRLQRCIFRRYHNIPDGHQEDILQTAFARCLEKHDPAFGTKFSTSLHRFVEWGCLDYLRGKQGVKCLQVTRLPEPAVHDREREDDLECVRECLPRLSDEDRLIINYRFDLGMSLYRIADVMGCSRSTAGRRLDDALGNLRRMCLGEVLGV